MKNPEKLLKCSKCGKSVKVLSRRKFCSKCNSSSKVSCGRCNKYFLPSNIRQRNCLKCFKKGKSIWTVASAGAPSLGKRR